MNTFPDFMKHPADRIARSNQATPGVEGGLLVNALPGIWQNIPLNR